MTISDFEKNYKIYENMAIWEISSLEEFMDGDVLLPQIFKEEYKFEWNDKNDPANHFSDPDMVVINKLLDYYGDKYFFVFSYNDPQHQMLKNLQDQKIINFGVDIYMIHPKKIYVLMMDRSQDPAAYDIL